MSVTYWSKDFWVATGERAIRTAAGALLALVAVAGFSPRTADWTDIAITVGLATAVSVLMAITANAATKSGPALMDSEQVVPPLPQPKDPVDVADNDNIGYVPERALNDDDPTP